MDFHYDPSSCDLCGSKNCQTLLDGTTGRAMCSDGRVIPCRLSKLACAQCGLVRSAANFGGLKSYYADEYTLNIGSDDYYFHTPHGRISRAALVCDWLVSSMGRQRWQHAKRCLEVGAGGGLLVREFMTRFPNSQFEGIELSKAAVALAGQRGLPVHLKMLEELPEGDHDIVYAVGVLEHVPAPTQFLNEIRKRLRPHGLLFLCQPTQDVPSYDVFFADHLSHFGTDHLHHYAAKCGFRQLGFVVGHELIPNFSVHLWEASPIQTPYVAPFSPGRTCCADIVTRVLGDMARLNNLLADLAARNRRVAVFGLNEVYALARANSRLAEHPLACGLDDVPDRSEYAKLGFPVMAPERCGAAGVQDVILTMNSVYYERVRPRLERLGIVVHDALTA